MSNLNIGAHIRIIAHMTYDDPEPHQDVTEEIFSSKKNPSYHFVHNRLFLLSYAKIFTINLLRIFYF